MGWARRHWIALLTGAAALYAAYRLFASGAGGHATPADAMSYGWAVVQSSEEGWTETSPDGKQTFTHDSGWDGS